MEAMAEGEGGPTPPLHAPGTRLSRSSSE
jgi:hypothetical protein